MKDLLTGEEFIPKRKSQKFASRANGIKYNNQKANELREKRAYIIKPLNKNHDFLIALLGNKREITVTSDFLEGRGFDFSKFTHHELVNNIKTPFVYEFCVIMFSGDNKVIIRKIC